MSRTDQRRRRVLRAVAPVAGLLAVGLLVWQGSYAAFSATTQNNSDAWTSGSLTLDNNGGTSDTFICKVDAAGDFCGHDHRDLQRGCPQARHERQQVHHRA